MGRYMYMRGQAFILSSILIILLLFYLNYYYNIYRSELEKVKKEKNLFREIELEIFKKSILNLQKFCVEHPINCSGINSTFYNYILDYIKEYEIYTQCKVFLIDWYYEKNYKFVFYDFYIKCPEIEYETSFYGFYDNYTKKVIEL